MASAPEVGDGAGHAHAATLRIDTAIEVDYYVHGGILPYVDSGELVTITYGRDRGGGLVVESIARNASLRTYYVR